MAHYAQTTEQDFQSAIGDDTQGASKSASVMGCKTLQTENENRKKPGKNRVLQSIASPCKVVEMGDTGFEPVTSTMSTWRSNQLS